MFVRECIAVRVYVQLFPTGGESMVAWSITFPSWGGQLYSAEDHCSHPCSNGAVLENKRDSQNKRVFGQQWSKSLEFIKREQPLLVLSCSKRKGWLGNVGYSKDASEILNF